jgi:type I restriction enzyme, S subunit
MSLELLFPNFEELIRTPEDVERLNEAILQLAVQGKLVPQEPNDEPASELLKEIEVQKTRLASEGKYRGETRVQPIEEENAESEIPQGWVCVQFGTVTIPRDGERIPVSKDERSHRAKIYDYYGASGVIDKIDDFLFDKPLLLIGEDGANLINRSTPIAFIARGKYWVNNHAHVIDGISEDFLKYLELYINAIDLKPYVTGTAQPKMNQAKMNSIPVALPPLAEQRRIVAKVDQLFAQTRALAEKLRRAQEEIVVINRAALHRLHTAESDDAFQSAWHTLRDHFDLLYADPRNVGDLRQTILDLAVRGKLVEQDPHDEPASELLKRVAREVKAGVARQLKPLPNFQSVLGPFEPPKGWQWTKMGDVADIASGVTLGRDLSRFETVALPYLRVANVQRGYLDLAEIKYIDVKVEEQDKYILQDGDLLLTEGGDADKLGRSAIWRDQISNCIHQNHIFRARPLANTVPAEWLMLYTNSTFGREYFLGSSKKTTNLASINSTQLKNCPVVLPPLQEQQRIMTKVEHLMHLCDELETKLQQGYGHGRRLTASVLR